MRPIVIQYARSHNAAKRGAGAVVERKRRIVEMKYFGGLTTEAIAEAMEISAAIVGREPRMGTAYPRTVISPGT